MARVTKQYVLDCLRDMFTDDPDASSLKELQEAFMQGSNTVVTQEKLRDACDVLVAEGMLELVGLDTYGATKAYVEAVERQNEESLAAIYAEHVIKQAAKK